MIPGIYLQSCCTAFECPFASVSCLSALRYFLDLGLKTVGTVAAIWSCGCMQNAQVGSWAKPTARYAGKLSEIIRTPGGST